MTSKDRQREMERARYERVQARMAQQQEAAKKRNKITAVVAVVAVVGIGVGVTWATSGGKKGTTPAASSTPTSPTDTSSPTPSAPTSTPEKIGYQKFGQAAKNVGVPTYNAAEAAKPYTATLHLNSGDVTFQALTTKAPYTTFSFKYLSGKGYYDNTPCHRLTTEASGIYVLQCGDPTGSGKGGPGYQFQDENLTGATYPAGTIAMANGGPGTNGSQFFIVYKDSPLPPAYTPWGKVTSGMDVINKIVATGEDNSNGQGDGKPKSPVTIKSVTIK